MLLRLSVLLSSIALAGCAKQKQDEAFIVPNGYVGPVVVVFEDPSGTDLLIEDTLVYFVDSDGIACVKNERPYGIFGADPVRVRDYDGTHGLGADSRPGRASNFSRSVAPSSPSTTQP